MENMHVVSLGFVFLSPSFDTEPNLLKARLVSSTTLHRPAVETLSTMVKPMSHPKRRLPYWRFPIIHQFEALYCDVLLPRPVPLPTSYLPRPVSLPRPFSLPASTRFNRKAPICILALSLILGCDIGLTIVVSSSILLLRKPYVFIF